MSRNRSADRRAFLETLALSTAVWSVLKDDAGAAGNEVITAVTLIKGIEGKEEELEAHLLSLAAPTRAEPGCVLYDLYRSPDKKNHFMRLEVWTSPEALEAHKATPHIRESFARRQKEGFTTEITVWRRIHG